MRICPRRRPRLGEGRWPRRARKTICRWMGRHLFVTWKARMSIPYYQIDAFTGSLFSGNPAGVCLLTDWLPDTVLQSIAAENNLAETAFVVQRGSHFDLRWFTPAIEVDLCGHATLASAHVIFRHLGYRGSDVRFQTRSGALTVTRTDDLLTLDFPARPAAACPAPADLIEGLGGTPTSTAKAR